MGKTDSQMEPDTELAADSTRPANRADGQGDSGEADRAEPVTPREEAPQEVGRLSASGQNTVDVQGEQAPVSGVSPALGRQLRVALENLRRAASDAFDKIEEAENLGMDFGSFLTALRIENGLFDNGVKGMQRAALVLDAIGSPVRLDAVLFTDEPIVKDGDRDEWTRDAGALARCAGRLMRDNPYETGTADAMQWRLGYLEQKEAEKATQSD